MAALIPTQRGGSAALPPLPVAASRAIADSDAERVLQCGDAVVLSLPAGLSSAFGARLLANAAAVAAGGDVYLVAASGVSINGVAGAQVSIVPAPGSTAPWMAWLQREVGADAYSLTVVGAVLTVSAPSTQFDEGVYLTLHSIGVNG